MIILGLMERFCRTAYKGITVFANILFFPGAIIMLSGMLVLAVVEIFVLDITWILLDFIDSKLDGKHWSLGDTIRYLMW